MIAPPEDLHPSSTAEKMADALRAGVSARLDWFEGSARNEDLAALDRMGDLGAAAAVARPGAFAPAVRAVRRVVQLLLRPLSAAQTAFNREIARHVVGNANAARALETRLAAVEDALRALETRIGMLEAAHGPDDGSLRGRQTDGLDAEAVEWMFVQSRLPALPARVLVVGGTRMTGRLARLGFHVVAIGDQPEADRATAMCRANAARLPFLGSVFAAVVLLSDRLAPEADPVPGSDLTKTVAGELARVLAPGGRLMVTSPQAVPAIQRSGVFTALEFLRATGSGPVRIAGEDELRGDTVPRETVRGIFVRADSHAPGG